MRFKPADPHNPAADRLVLSDGHAVPAVYAAYADLGGAFRVHGLHCRRMPKSTRSAEAELDYCGVGVEQICATAQGLVG